MLLVGLLAHRKVSRDDFDPNWDFFNGRYLMSIPFAAATAGAILAASVVLQVARLLDACNGRFPASFAAALVLLSAATLCMAAKEAVWPSRWRRLPTWWRELHGSEPDGRD